MPFFSWECLTLRDSQKKVQALLGKGSWHAGFVLQHDKRLLTTVVKYENEWDSHPWISLFFSLFFDARLSKRVLVFYLKIKVVNNKQDQAILPQDRECLQSKWSIPMTCPLKFKKVKMPLLVCPKIYQYGALVNLIAKIAARWHLSTKLYHYSLL